MAFLTAITPRLRFVIVAGLTLLPLVAVLVGIFAVVYLPVFGAFERLVQRANTHILPLHELQTILLSSAMPPNDYVLHGDEGERGQFHALAERVDNALARARTSLADDAQGTAVLAAVNEDWRLAREKANRLLAWPDPVGDPNAAELTERFDADLDRASDRLGAFLETLHADVARLEREAESRRDTGLLAMGLATAATVALGLGAAILLTRQRRVLVETSERDPLTGLYNRRAFEARLALAVDDRRAETSVFSLLVVDLDNFKHVNDTHGHQAGDVVLRQTADLIRRHLRTSDFFARFGGDEFVILAGDTDGTAAIILAERIREALEGKEIDIGETVHLKQTVTIGLAAYPADGERPSALFAAADQALYRAKVAGRNRVAGFVNLDAEAAQ